VRTFAQAQRLVRRLAPLPWSGARSAEARHQIKSVLDASRRTASPGARIQRQPVSPTPTGASQQGSLSYRIDVRRFEGRDVFAGGFKGDNRTFSTKETASYRTGLHIKFDLVKRELTHVGGTTSGSAAVGRLAKTVSFWSNLSTDYEKDADVRVTGSVDALGDRSVRIQGSSVASDPLPLFAPDLNTSIDLTVSVVGSGAHRFLYILGQLKGDPFPDAEVILADGSRNRIMLATFNELSATTILGGNENTGLVDINAFLPIDENGALSNDRPATIVDRRFEFTYSKPQSSVAWPYGATWAPPAWQPAERSSVSTTLPDTK